jgi:hypothetical protein
MRFLPVAAVVAMAWVITSDELGKIEKAYEPTYITTNVFASRKNSHFRPFWCFFFKSSDLSTGLNVLYRNSRDLKIAAVKLLKG